MCATAFHVQHPKATWARSAYALVVPAEDRRHIAVSGQWHASAGLHAVLEAYCAPSRLARLWLADTDVMS
jgi:hypothetical protein